MTTAHVAERIYPISTQSEPYVPHVAREVLLVFSIDIPSLSRVGRVSEHPVLLALLDMPSQQFGMPCVSK